MFTRGGCPCTYVMALTLLYNASSNDMDQIYILMAPGHSKSHFPPSFGFKPQLHPSQCAVGSPCLPFITHNKIYAHITVSSFLFVKADTRRVKQAIRSDNHTITQCNCTFFFYCVCVTGGALRSDQQCKYFYVLSVYSSAEYTDPNAFNQKP